MDSQIRQGNVSLGKSLVADMTGLTAIPEEVTFSVPVFAQAALHVTQPVRICIDPDPQNERFTLVVIPGDIEHAWASAEEWTGKALTDELHAQWEVEHEDACPIPIYRGQP